MSPVVKDEMRKLWLGFYKDASQDTIRGQIAYIRDTLSRPIEDRFQQSVLAYKLEVLQEMVNGLQK